MTQLTKISCWCGIEFAMPASLYNECRENNKVDFHCPLGHANVFRESRSASLRREMQRLEQRMAEQEDYTRRERERAEAAERSARAYKGQTTRLKRRAKAGLCPCCNRHFVNLERHIQSQHPDMKPDEEPPELKVVDGGKA